METYARAAGEIAEVLGEAVQSTRRVAAWNAQAAGPWIAEPPQLARGVKLPAERVGEAAIWPPPDRLDVAAMVPAELVKRDEAISAEAKEAAEAWSQLERANQLQKGARRKVLAGSWG